MPKKQQFLAWSLTNHNKRQNYEQKKKNARMEL